MKNLPKLGTRVRYVRQWNGEADPTRTCTGTIVALYPSDGIKYKDEETGDEWISRHAASVKVDSPLPSWWPYTGSDCFAPDIAELEPL